MQYLLLFYVDEHYLSGLSPQEETQFAAASRLSADLLQSSGQLLVGGALPAVDSVATVARHAGQVTLTAAPVSTSASQLRAFYVIEARDLNAAIQAAAHLPQAHYGWLEVRSVIE